MLKIAICDDEKAMCSIIEKIVLAFSKETGQPIDTSIFYRGESLSEYLDHGNRFDLIFLDIEMTEMNGIDVSNKIRKDIDDIDTEIVYVSCTTQYDRTLFEFHPLAFIAKPLKKTELEKVLNLALKRKNIKNPYFSFSYNREKKNLPYREILYFESDDRKVNIVTKSAQYSYYGRLSDVLTVIPEFFCQIHRSYIINLNHVTEFSRHDVTMYSGQKINVGKAYQDSFAKCRFALLEEE